MKQADEVVVAFGARKGGTNARLKPKSASNDSAISTTKPGSQLARLAIRRCWLSSWGSSATEDLIFPKDRLIGWHGDLPEILVVPLTEPLVQYGESSRNHTQRPVPSAASRVFGCDADRRLVHGLCQHRCEMSWLLHNEPFIMDMTPSKEVGASAISTRLLVKPWCVWSMQVWTLWNWKRMLLHEPSS